MNVLRPDSDPVRNDPIMIIAIIRETSSFRRLVASARESPPDKERVAKQLSALAKLFEKPKKSISRRSLQLEIPIEKRVIYSSVFTPSSLQNLVHIRQV